MTPSTKPVTRLTSAYFRDRGFRPIIATIIGSMIELRCKGLRSVETIDVAALYSYALKARLADEKAQRKKNKKKK
jgi:hypothetical protein